MFFPAWLGSVFLLLNLIGGAVLGALLGWISSSLLRLKPTSRWLDAAMGVTAVLALGILVLIVTRGTTTSVDGHTLGRRGWLVDHIFIWTLGLIAAAVVGRQLIIAGDRRRV
jgi:hypothetical protein